jgi:hypothetical protein
LDLSQEPLNKNAAFFSQKMAMDNGHGQEDAIGLKHLYFSTFHRSGGQRQ